MRRFERERSKALMRFGCARPKALRRRELIALASGALAWPTTVRAQQPGRVRRIGLLSAYSRTDFEIYREAFRTGLRELGWVEGSNIDIEIRDTEGDAERLPQFVDELLKLKVEVLVASATSAAQAAQKAAGLTPIVMVNVGDPVASGLVVSLARPGGNITGLSLNQVELVGKRLEMLKLTLPDLSDVAVLWSPNISISAINWQALQEPSRRLGIKLHSMEMENIEALDNAQKSEVGANVRALYVTIGIPFTSNPQRVAEFAVKRRLASIASQVEYVRAGGLLAFGADRRESFRRAASYVDKILKGANPADLPVEQPNKFETGVNLKTARALGITIPPLILTQADEVIE
jgi:putative tryptophan/tyrosine transport system substrate-binding protein